MEHTAQARTPKTWTSSELDDMVQLYTVVQMSVYSISRRVKESAYLVRQALVSRGIEIKPARGPFSDEEISEMIRLNTVEKLGIGKIAKKFDSSFTTVRRYLVRAGVKIRSQSQKLLSETQKQEVAKAYGEGVPIGELANRYGCSTFPIREAVREIHGVGSPSKTTRTKHLKDGFKHLPRAIYEAKKSSATNHGIGWDIDIHDIETCFERQKGHCFYSGLELKTAARHVDFQHDVAWHPQALSIDRRDSDGGYTPDNIVLCCRFINYAKNSWSEPLFKQVLSDAAAKLSERDFVEERARTEDSVTA